MRHIVCLFVCLFASTAFSEAATRTVCSSGCQYTNLQTAINEAVPGDTILLRAGQTYYGNYTLKAKSGSSTSFITIKSDAGATSLPGEGVRLVPQGKPGANTQRSALARLIGQGGSYKSLPVVRVEPGAHHYRLQFLEIDGTANLGYGTLVVIGNNDSTQTTAAAAPYGIVLDRVWIHGHAWKGIRRGVAINGRSVDLLNSYIDDIYALGDSQAIAAFNAPGPVRIINNFLEATGENILLGGDDPKILNLVPSDFEIRGNHTYKDPAWKNPVLKTPSTPSLSARTGGSLAAGTHYFKVVAVMTPNSERVLSAPSGQASVTVGSGGAVALSWGAVGGADKYRVYRGTASNAQSKYIEISTTSVTYTGASELSGTPPATGTRWTYKNHLELKNAQRITIDGNLFENNWAGFQNGYAILFTPKNQNHTAPWTVVKDVVFSNNVLRHSSMGINISGRDWESSTQQARNIRIYNNVFEDLSAAYGNKGAFLLIAAGPADIVVDHNTIVHEGAVLEVEGPVVPGFVYTNNFSRHNQYGIKGSKRAVGTDSLNTFFSGWTFRANVLAGGPASSYPSGNYFPTTAEFVASFVAASAGDYALVSTSAFRNQATDGRDIGVNMPTFRLAQAAQVTAGSVPTPTPTPEPAPTPAPTPAPPAGTLPEGWQSEDVGAVGQSGAASASSGTFVVKGAGADVWGTADAFHFAYRPLSGDGTIVARVASLDGSDVWTKAGVMIRTATDARSAHAFMLVSKAKGLAFQRRKSNGASSLHTSGGSGTAPRWVKLTRAGNVITAYSSVNGSSWTLVGSDTFSMPAEVLVGVATNSHNVSSLATAAFDNVAVSAGQALPSGWSSNDIGAVGLSGSASHDGDTFTVQGAGDDIWGTADGLHLAWRTLPGDGEIVARVASVEGSMSWTKVGVMMRQSLDAGSAHAMMFVSAGKGFKFQRRPVTGGISLSTDGGVGTAPEWVKLTRVGQVVTASISPDGTTWRTVGSETMSMVGEIHVGLAVTSHTDLAVATGTFDNVQVTER
jgi:regulation of enolase protein 1 (concanavalin A-like superfamily)